MKKYLPIMVLLGSVALFIFGLAELFESRFAGGDVYPAYSSLRADPLGTMAFYESLGKMPGLSVRRDFSESNRLPDEPGTVYLHLAAEPNEWKWVPEDLFREVKNFLARGGRLVITFYPETEKPYQFYDDNDDETNAVKTVKDQKTTADKKKWKKSREDESEVSLEDEWGFHPSFEKLAADGDSYEPVSVFNRTDLALPDSLDWHSGMIFTNVSGAWRTIYARGTNAVVIERRFGQGSVVMAGDSFFLSNEAMAGDRQAKFLAWLLGANRNVVFDEAHLGIVEAPGVAVLMRQYRLHGLAAGLLLLTLLFIWKNSSSLVPPPAEEKRGDFVSGKDTASGFVNLLRRSVAPRDLLATCFQEWKKSVVPGGKISAARRQQAEAIFEAENLRSPGERHAGEAYKKISEVLGNRKQKT